MTSQQSHASLRLEIQDLLQGADNVHTRIKSAFQAIDGRYGSDVFQFKSRVKSGSSIFNKIVKKRRKTESQNYSLSQMQDIIGFRFTTLYGDRLLSIFDTAMDFIELCRDERLGLFSGSSASDNISSIIVYIRRQDKDDPYVKAYKLLKNKYANVIPVTFETKEEGYSSIHILLEAKAYIDGNIRRVPIEIQLRTALEDIWAEISHELAYKEEYTIRDQRSPLNRVFIEAKNNLLRFKKDINSASEFADTLRDSFDYIERSVSPSIKNTQSGVFRDRRNSIPSILIEELSVEVKKLFSDHIDVLNDIHSASFSRNEQTKFRSFALDAETLQTVSETVRRTISMQNKKNFTHGELLNEVFELYRLHYEIADIHTSLPKISSAHGHLIRLKNIDDTLKKTYRDDLLPYSLWLRSVVARFIGEHSAQLDFTEDAYSALLRSECIKKTELSFLIPSDCAYTIFEFKIWKRLLNRKGKNRLKILKSDKSNIEKALKMSIYALERFDEYVAKNHFDYADRHRATIIVNIISFLSMHGKCGIATDIDMASKIWDAIREFVSSETDHMNTDSLSTTYRAHTVFLAAKLLKMELMPFKDKVINSIYNLSIERTAEIEYILEDLKEI